jgi:hypothetical protein
MRFHPAVTLAGVSRMGSKRPCASRKGFTRSMADRSPPGATSSWAAAAASGLQAHMHSKQTLLMQGTRGLQLPRVVKVGFVCGVGMSAVQDAHKSAH